MSTVVNSLVPIFILFALGILLRILNIVDTDAAEISLKLVFYLSLPALLLTVLPDLQLSTELLILPVSATIIFLMSYFMAYLLTNTKQLDRNRKGIFLISSMIMNTGFNLPFVLVFLGPKGVALTSMFDIGNAILTMTLAYGIAVFYGADRSDETENSESIEQITFFNHEMISKLVRSPPIWALVIGLVLNILDYDYPKFIQLSLQPLVNLLTPLIMISLGIYFSPKILDNLFLYIPLFIRIVMGSIMGLLITRIVSVDPLIEIVIIIGAAAPIGFNTLTFSSLEKLDNEYAANIVSFGIIIGMIYIPILLWILA